MPLRAIRTGQVDFMNDNATNNGSNDKALSVFRRCGELKNYPPGVELYRQGEVIKSAYLLESGLVKHVHAGKRGNEMVLDLRSPGKILGAASIILRNPALVTGATLTECLIYSLTSKAFLNELKTDIEFSQCILRMISQQFYEQVLRQARLGTAPSRSRLAQILLQFIETSAHKSGGEIRLQLPVSNSDLAGLLAIAPSYLSRLLGELEKKGVIRRSKGWIYIRSIDLLRWEAE